MYTVSSTLPAGSAGAEVPGASHPQELSRRRLYSGAPGPYPFSDSLQIHFTLIKVYVNMSETPVSDIFTHSTHRLQL